MRQPLFFINKPVASYDTLSIWNSVPTCYLRYIIAELKGEGYPAVLFDEVEAKIIEEPKQYSAYWEEYALTSFRDFANLNGINRYIKELEGMNGTLRALIHLQQEAALKAPGNDIFGVISSEISKIITLTNDKKNEAFGAAFKMQLEEPGKVVRQFMRENATIHFSLGVIDENVTKLKAQKNPLRAFADRLFNTLCVALGRENWVTKDYKAGKLQEALKDTVAEKPVELKMVV